ncbi:hypothetical protein FRZ67_16060 [Panacibacter ginsenosidivorans]|uniref:Uncharacterized protein n=1 Tax=Panacibacter ginsenosidivorans TaxID=1813871 RepID=A0A5B8VCJ0_9BACT|nr:hypothetical protein [Panacibacter ginsenosidivorans]QEC68745.1 hypothetical protein FRZ67_16060 [Panacibacter ginsenosidivorans]
MTAKNIFLSIAYVLVVLFVLSIVNFAFIYLLNGLVLDMFNWFNGQSFIIKLLVLFIGGSLLIGLMFNVFTGIAAFISEWIFNFFPKNAFTIWTSLILAVINAFYLMIKLWQTPNEFNFWVVIELIIMTLFVWSLNLALVMTNFGDKRKN